MNNIILLNYSSYSSEVMTYVILSLTIGFHGIEATGQVSFKNTPLKKTYLTRGNIHGLDTL